MTSPSKLCSLFLLFVVVCNIVFIPLASAEEGGETLDPIILEEPEFETAQETPEEDTKFNPKPEDESVMEILGEEEGEKTKEDEPEGPDLEETAPEEEALTEATTESTSEETEIDLDAPRFHPEIDEFTGALTYSYNIVTPPGRNGIEPNLALNYNSGDEDKTSILGLGWSLNIPSIQRINREGTQDLYDGDTFTSSLSGELIALDATTYGAKSEKGDFLNYERVGDAWVVTDKSGTTYTFGSSEDARQDDPADNSRIYKWMLEEIRDLNDNFISYTYTNSGGQIYPDEIRYTGHGSSEGIFSINFSHDTAITGGNNDFSRAFEVTAPSLIDAITISVSGTEVRSYALSYSLGHNQTRSLLESIQETAISEAGVETTLPATTFEYQEDATGWELEEDWEMPTYSNGTDLRGYNGEMSGSIDTQLLDVNGDGLQDFVVLQYGSITGDPALDTFHRVFLNTGEGWELEEDWQMPMYTDGTNTYGYNGEYSSIYTQFLDVNGDGLPDFVVLQGNGNTITGDPALDTFHRVFLNTGRGWELDENWEMPAYSNGTNTYGYNGEYSSIDTQFLDVNGDSLADFVVLYTYTSPITGDPATDTFHRVFLNTGEGWELEENWQMPTHIRGTDTYAYNGEGSTSIDTQFLDVNGDGLPDFVILYSFDTAITGDPAIDLFHRVFLNTGEGWELKEDWQMPVYSNGTDFRGYNGEYNSSIDTQFLDVNGDGLPDFVVLYSFVSPITGDPAVDNFHRVFLNTGEGWELDENWEMPAYSNGTDLRGYNGEMSGSIDTQFLDVNGDTLQDFVVLQYGSITGDPAVDNFHRVFLNTGEGWELEEDWQMPVYTDGTNTYGYNGEPYAYLHTQFSDINSDGLLDFIALQSYSSPITGDPAQDNFHRVFLSQGKASDRLSEITLSSGGTVSVTYEEEPIVDRNPYGETQTFYAVSQITRDDGYGENSLNYEYADGKFYFHEDQYRSFTGFGTVTVTDEEGNARVVYRHQGNESNSDLGEYNDAVSKIGLVYRTEEYDETGALYKVTVQQWYETNLSTGRDFAKQTRQTFLTYDGSSHKDSATEYSYDDATGNLTTETHWGEVSASEDGSFQDLSTLDEKFIITYTYAVDSTQVVKNKVAQKKITSSSETEKTRYYYDGLSYGAVSLGNITREARSFNNSWQNIHYTYSAEGLVETVKNPRNYTTTYSYDSENLYPETVTNPKGYTVEFAYDYSSGKIVSKTDENGITSQYTYDGFSRPLTVSVPDPISGTLTLLSSTTYNDNFPSSSTTVSTVNGVNTLQSLYFDGFKREVQRLSSAEGGTYTAVDTWYDRGNVIQQTYPYETQGAGRDVTKPSIVNTYAAQNRPLTVTTPHSSTTYSYSLWEVLTENPNFSYKTFEYNYAGQLISVEEQNGGLTYATTYTYDPLGRLINLTDAEGNERNFIYDSLGRKVSEEDLHRPSATTIPTWTYTYDANGNLATRTDPLGEATSWTYDNLDRVRYEDSSLTGRETTYTYDTATRGLMKVYKIISDGGGKYVQYPIYDYLGNPSKEQIYIQKPGLSTYYSYVYQTTYDLLKRPTRIIYPSAALTINYSYNEAGLLETVTRGTATAVVNMDYNALGQIETQTYGNGKILTNTYDETGRLMRKQTNNLEDLNYTYDAVGNILQIVDSVTPKTITYSYDALDRLVRATSSGRAEGDYDEMYEYDSLGNLSYRTSLGELLYEGAHPHAVSSAAGLTYTYDANGNLLTDGVHSYAWENNRLITADGKAFGYDFSGSRYKTVELGDYSYYINAYQEQRGGTETSAGNTTYYIFAGGQRLAIREGTNIIYNHQDHLGGTAFTTDRTGAVSQVYEYLPYGEELESSGTTDAAHSFTDKELDDDLGLYYFEARWYNPLTGRFISADPAQHTMLGQIMGDPQSLNAYTYARNNPLIYIDPTGLKSAVVFYGKEYREGSDPNAWKDKADSRAEDLRNLKNEDGSLVYEDGVYSADGTTFENWASALNTYSDIGLIEYYGHGDKDGIYLRDTLTESNEVRYETIFSNYFNGQLDSYTDGTSDHYVKDLTLGNTSKDLIIKLWSCSTAESGYESVAQSFSNHFLAPVYASNSADSTYFLGNYAFTSPLSSGGFDWRYPSWMSILESTINN
ncbi:VCBS repeat-containing protein [Candidatus Peregrinibacteria bacterium]|nr:MAG: VCBS repeat-containing protein [Candidatus Peregrinibacteria bacterium]